MVKQAQDRIDRVLSRVILSREEDTIVLEQCSQTDPATRFWLNPFENSSRWVDIGGVKIERTVPAKLPEMIPFNVPYAGTVCDFDCKEIRQHLRWMMQKELLGQDMFLIGPPGPYRRWLSFMFCEFIGRPASYVSLTRDTSESDLKQRREIRNNSAIYEDLLVVKAATEGHVLIIEGIEKCERNVLPVLNNLLENREMLLEDGRFLVNHKRYDNLLKEVHGGNDAALRRLNLIRAHPDFRVIALGLPVPQYPGNPMDPPLRSRFQCRDIIPSLLESHMAVLPKGISQHNEDTIELMRKLVTFSDALQRVSMDEEQQTLPHFPDTPGLLRMLQILTKFPHSSVKRLVHRVYPYSIITDEAEQAGLDIAIKRFLVSNPQELDLWYRIISINTHSKQTLEITLQQSTSQVQTLAVGGKGKLNDFASTASYYQLEYHNRILGEMIQDHLSEIDICIVGEKGIGKSSLAQRFCSILGYSPAVTMHLYQDMSARDLLQRRATQANGDTVWELTPLIRAALSGSVAILDGIDRLVPSTFSILQRLCQDRECTLFDGTQLVRKSRFDVMMSKYSLDELHEKKIFPVHPSFRILALANLPSPSCQWLTSEVIPMFHFHYMSRYSVPETTELLHALFPELSVEHYIKPLLQLDEQVRNKANDGNADSWRGFTFRQLLRLCKRWKTYPLSPKDLEELNSVAANKENAKEAENLHLLHEIVHAGFMSNHTEQISLSDPVVSIEIKTNPTSGAEELFIGKIHFPVQSPQNPALVPHVNFFNMPTHIRILQRMLQDFVIQEPLLLIGPQGVGKNMLADRLLELLNVEREYIQLHRDTSVQSLTLSPALYEGVITWEDSPLVSAVRFGRCLVVDEADKAPLEVVCILKGLIEDGEMLLSNGKRILSSEKIQQLPEQLQSSELIIEIHKEFRIFVLANKQGYPFLGNDLLQELGDCFSCHIINNPDEESEIALLRFYGPDLTDEVLLKLTHLFSDLRRLVDDGLLSYPYSTRELVNIVKHLQKYPEDGLVTTIENVFSFDGYDAQLLQHLTQVFHRHGLPVGGNRVFVNTSTVYPFGKRIECDNWRFLPGDMKVECELHPIVLKGSWFFPDEITRRPEVLSSRRASRIKKFAEEVYQWEANNNSSTSSSSSLSGRVTDLCTLPDGSVHILLNDPMKIHSYDPHHRQFIVWELTSHLRYSSMPNMSEFPFRFNLIALPNSNSLLVYIPSFSVGLVLCLSTLEMKVLSLDITEGSIALYNDIVYLGYRRQLSANVRKEKEKTVVRTEWAQLSQTLPNHDNCSSDKLIFFIPGEKSFRIINFDGQAETGGEIFQIFCFCNGIANVLPLVSPARDSFIIEDLNGSLVFMKIKWNDGGIAVPVIIEQRKISKTSNQAFSYSFCSQMKESNQIYLGNATSLHCESQGSNSSRQNPLHEQEIRLFRFPRTEYEQETLKVTSSLFLSHSAHVLHVLVQPSLGHQSPILLQIVDPQNHSYRVIELPPDTQQMKRNRGGISSAVDDFPRIWIQELANGRICVLEESGRVRIFEVVSEQLENSLFEWKKLLGSSARDNQDLTLTIDYDGSRDVTAPKEGKPTDGKEHHGGNTWQEGTGGADTPGLGGKGGPYRKEGSFDTYQISDEQKEKMSEEAKQARKEMSMEMRRKQLEAIDMSEFSASEYKQFLDAVKLQVGQLRVIVESVRAKQKERAWLRHKTQGELDDMKLVDGLVGERNVYKQRGEIPPTAASFQQKPKRLHFAMDVSGSMYRFNGQDRRLDRLLESVCMIMESFHGYESKYSYSIAGHSGDGPHVPFVEYEKPPSGPKERLKVLQKMKVHTEYCSSGDSTLEALRLGMKYVVEKEGDDHFVFLVSDANLSRYNISPKALADWMNSDKRVHCYAIFIASMAEEAEKLTRELPPGKSFVCLNTSMLPAIFKQIFTNSLLQDQ